MFILISAKEETLSPDNECKAFDDLHKAQAEMLRQFFAVARDENYQLHTRSWLGDGMLHIETEDVYDDDSWVGVLSERHAFFEYVHQWVIFEV